MSFLESVHLQVAYIMLDNTKKMFSIKLDCHLNQFYLSLVNLFEQPVNNLYTHVLTSCAESIKGMLIMMGIFVLDKA